VNDEAHRLELKYPIMIDVSNLWKSFGKKDAVQDASFKAEPGRIFGLLGPNGAGKTTTIRMINDILTPDRGEVRIKNVIAGPQTQKWIGYMPEERGLYKKMKVGEQLLYFAKLKGLSTSEGKKVILRWLERFEASDWIKQEVGELSKGMSQKIQFIATILHDPDIAIFDEPFSGLDPINSELLKTVILELKAQGKTILFSTHRMEQVEQMCDDIALFNEGQVVLTGNLAEIKSSFGENTVLLEYEGDGAFIDDLENVRINNRSNRFAEIRILEGQTASAILKQAINHVEVKKFEQVEPSLTEIFISTVNSTKGMGSAA
jgi:ABC-2 type transport system ATP-binding protein